MQLNNQKQQYQRKKWKIFEEKVTNFLQECKDSNAKLVELIERKEEVLTDLKTKYKQTKQESEMLRERLDTILVYDLKIKKLGEHHVKEVIKLRN